MFSVLLDSSEVVNHAADFPRTSSEEICVPHLDQPLAMAALAIAAARTSPWKVVTVVTGGLPKRIFKKVVTCNG